MSIKVGERTLATSVTAETRAALEQATGLSVAEVRERLERAAYPAHVAAALHPLLRDPMPLADLAAIVAAGDVDALRLQVAALLAEKAPA